MKIVSWNCHYGLTKEKCQALLTSEGKQFFNAEIYAFQEVKENDFIFISDYGFSDEYKYCHWYGDHKEFGNCHEAKEWEGDLGIVLISKMKFQRFDQGIMRFRYVIPYVFYDEQNEKKFILIHVWTKGQPDGYFEPVYKAMEYYKNKFPKLPIIMIGDFNFGVTFDDKFIHEFALNINKEICDLQIAKLVGNEKRTFYYPRCAKTKYFNDCLFTKGCEAQFEVGDSKAWIPKISDHCPIVAEIEL